MLQRFPTALMRKHGEKPYTHITNKFWEGFVTYVVDQKYRKSVQLKYWIRQQLTAPSKTITSLVEQILDFDSYDKIMLAILELCQKKPQGELFKYVGDYKSWGVAEKWQTASETMGRMAGDCEDVAILMYVIARLKGVPAHRLYIMAGWVDNPINDDEIGHCWLAYRPDNYPLNWAFLDWCYYTNTNISDHRPLFHVQGKEIIGYKHLYGRKKGTYDKYYSIWFAFNEDHAHHTLRYKTPEITIQSE